MSRVVYLRPRLRRAARARKSWVGVGFGQDVFLLLIASRVLCANDNGRCPASGPSTRRVTP
jgi:hypothetical protein